MASNWFIYINIRTIHHLLPGKSHRKCFRFPIWLFKRGRRNKNLPPRHLPCAHINNQVSDNPCQIIEITFTYLTNFTIFGKNFVSRERFYTS
ncbi:MAG: hypothetical protein JETT_2856 [Candidatus Jettenia ecosi]|uniref:Uncharacterized protein n=1 Tax=Candidatus Jettenia ecosi TaxID=2494326 RepID=A0A533Q8B0_9BACT|nr:MAG: hypothetical protein JETT_2856 [Candidatus Jettenia ecosi]